MLQPLKFGNCNSSHPTVYQSCDYLSLLESKLHHVSKQAPGIPCTAIWKPQIHKYITTSKLTCSKTADQMSVVNPSVTCSVHFVSLSFLTHNIFAYIYIYIYMCVCVCIYICMYWVLRRYTSLNGFNNTKIWSLMCTFKTDSYYDADFIFACGTGGCPNNNLRCH